jgi:hypothetical protein
MILENHTFVAETEFKDAQYRAQFIFTIFRARYELVIQKYSRGDPLAEIAALLPETVNDWEWAYEEEIKVFSPDQMARRKHFPKNLDFYVSCFWLYSLALCLGADDELLRRMVKLFGNEGEDSLFDRVIRQRFPERRVGETLLYPRPYLSLAQAIDATPEKRDKLLAKFVGNWYSQMKRTYWHDCHTGMDGGGYFGYWCFEAAGVIKAFELDDSAVREMPYYPKDLLHG